MGTVKSPINSETSETVKPLEQDPEKVLALVDLIFLCVDAQKTIPS